MAYKSFLTTFILVLCSCLSLVSYGAEFKDAVLNIVESVCEPYTQFHKDILKIWREFPHESFNLPDGHTNYPVSVYYSFKDGAGIQQYHQLTAVSSEQQPINFQPDNIGNFDRERLGLLSSFLIAPLGPREANISEEKILFVATVSPLFVMTASVDVFDSQRKARSRHDVTLKFPTYGYPTADRYGFARKSYRFVGPDMRNIGFREEAHFSSLVPELDALAYEVHTRQSDDISSVEICTNMPFIPLYIAKNYGDEFFDRYVLNTECARSSSIDRIQLTESGGNWSCSN